MSTVMPRVVIVAAGRGSRLRHYTADRPKCLLPFGSKTLLQRQLEAFASCGLTDIHLVRGYRSEMIDYRGITFHENRKYESNNILCSLFCAEPVMEGPLIISYADILFESSIVQKLLESKHGISIVMDTDWREYYLGRVEHPISEAEAVILDTAGKVKHIGKIAQNDQTIDGEFIGMALLTARGVRLLKEAFHQAAARYRAGPFQRAASFDKAYLTDLLQEMVEQGHDIQCVPIQRGWKEIDTVEDYEKALLDFGAVR